MKFYGIGEAAHYLGKCTNTLRSWDKTGKLIPARRYEYGKRMYSEQQLQEKLKELEEKG